MPPKTSATDASPITHIPDDVFIYMIRLAVNQIFSNTSETEDYIKSVRKISKYYKFLIYNYISSDLQVHIGQLIIEGLASTTSKKHPERSLASIKLKLWVDVKKLVKNGIINSNHQIRHIEAVTVLRFINTLINEATWKNKYSILFTKAVNEQNKPLRENRLKSFIRKIKLIKTLKENDKQIYDNVLKLYGSKIFERINYVFLCGKVNSIDEETWKEIDLCISDLRRDIYIWKMKI